MSDNRRNDGGIIFAVVLIAVGAWLLLGRVLGDWWAPMRTVFRVLGSLALPLALIAIGVLILLAAQGRLGTLGLRGRRLYRSRTERMVAGVLGGLSEVIGIDPTILRIAYAIFTVASGGGPGIILYIVAAIVVPEAPTGQPVAPVWPGDATGRETVQTPPPPPPADRGTGHQPPAPPAPPVP